MKQISLLLFVLFINTLTVNAQNVNSVHIESVDYLGIKKESSGKCFFLSFVKSKTRYAVILISKEFLVDPKEIKVLLNQEQNSEPLTITISIDDKDLAKTKKLIAIPYFIIRNQLQEDSAIIQPVFMIEDFIPEMMTGITEKDIDDLKKEMEKQMTE